MDMDATLEGEAELQQDLKRLEEKWTGSAVWLVGTNKEYGPAIEFGAGPHLIEADDAEALRFEINGQVVYAQSVEHPGNDAQPFLRPAAERTRRRLPVLAEESDTIEEFVQNAALYLEAEAKKIVAVDDGPLRASITAVEDSE